MRPISSGAARRPVDAYLDIEDILRIAIEAKADAIHPGYGFLSENPDFVEACNREGVIFVGPTPEIMRTLGNKVAARNLATSAGVPVMPATPPLPADIETCKQQAAEVGYPVMLKASWGGGGRGMRVIESDAQLTELLPVARREAKAGFGNDEVYLEKLVRKARHIEVQILGDTHGNLVHLYERDCTVQRRNQKVVERAPAAFLSTGQRNELCGYALRIGNGSQLPQCGHGRIPAGRRDRQVLFHRGESAHPGGAHRHRGRDRHRSGESPDTHRRRREDRRGRQRRAAAGSTSM